MKLLDTCPLDGFNDAKLDEPVIFNVELPDGRQLDYDTLISHTPAVTSDYDGFSQPQMQFNTDELPDWDEFTYYPAGRLDRIHGRNLEVLADSVAIEDRFGNQFKSICIKGSDMSKPSLVESITASRDHIIYGLQESLVMERVIRASQVLREHGVGTEYICGLVLPESFPVDTNEGENRGLNQLSRLSLPQLLERLATSYAEEAKDLHRPPLEVKSDMIELFKDCDYLITYRGMDCPFRLGELSDDDKFETLMKFIAKNNDGPGLEEYLAEIHPVTFIMGDVVPELANNVALMHKIGKTGTDENDENQGGVAHGFLHVNNITAMGSIVDLDSCKGEALGLGDKAPIPEHFFRDITDCINSIQAVLEDMATPLHENALEYLEMQDNKYWSAAYFLYNYLQERFDDLDTRLRFLARFTASQAPADSHNFNDLQTISQIAVGATHMLLDGKPSEAQPDDIPVFKLESLAELEHHDSFLRSVPPRFFRDMSDKLIDGNWTMNNQHAAIADNQRQAHNPVKASLRNLSLRAYINHARESGYTNNALGFLSGVAFGVHLDNIVADAEFTDMGDQRFHEYFMPQTRAIIERLASVEANPFEVVLKEVLGDYLEEIRDQIGYLPPSVDRDDPPTPIVYLSSTEQYSEFFAELGIDDNNLDVTVVTALKALTYFDEDDTDLLMIADYDIAKLVAEDHSLEKVLMTLFSYRPFKKPLIIVRGLSTGQLRLELVFEELRELENQEVNSRLKHPDTSRQLLLAMGALKGTAIDQQQLFDASEFWTKPVTDDKLV